VEEPLAVSSVMHVITAIIQLNEANGAVSILLQSKKLATISKRTLLINTCILEIGIQERLLQCKRLHT
jgi:hypothetical protein